jgi:hypothetical protein
LSHRYPASPDVIRHRGVIYPKAAGEGLSINEV